MFNYIKERKKYKTYFFYISGKIKNKIIDKLRNYTEHFRQAKHCLPQAV